MRVHSIAALRASTLALIVAWSGAAPLSIVAQSPAPIVRRSPALAAPAIGGARVTAGRPESDATKGWMLPRTPWGDPDLQGMWPSGRMTGVPFERPERFGERTLLTDDEFAQREAQIKRSFEGFVIGAWGEAGQAQRQASLIVEPANGRMPPMTAEGQRRSATLKSSWQTIWFNGPEDLDTWDRCITRGLLPSMLPAQYSNGIQIHQAPGYVVIRNEMIHEARVIPLDGRPHPGSAIKQYLGDSRGRWDGNTLVVDTTNFNGRTAATNPGTTGSPMQNNVPTSESLRIVERFTRVDAETINYEARVEDPTIFTGPWKVAFPLAHDPAYQMFEYTCHEHNYALKNLITGSQAERAALERIKQ
jgi:hypothetical protein